MKDSKVEVTLLFNLKVKRSTLVHLGISIIAVILFLIIWDRYSAWQMNPYLPRPHQVFGALFESFFETNLTGNMGQHIAASLVRVLYGFVLALLVAVPIGMLMGWSKYAFSAGLPIVEAFRPIPPLAWIPFAIVFFAYPFDTTFIVFLGVLFPVLLSTIFGVQSIDPNILDAARILGAKRKDMLLKVIFPATLPHMMTGMRVGLGVGWMCIVAAEMIGVNSGVGYYILTMHTIGRYDYMFAGMVMIGIIGFILTTTITILERRMAKWQNA